MQDVWRPLSLEPSRTWNAFFSMFVPLVAVGFVGLLWNRERRWILPPILAMGVLSMVVGYLQALGADSLYFYRVTHGHHPVGLFANKNHQAVLLNWLTTGDHLLKTMLLEPYWAVAGVDLSLLACALVSVFTARRLARTLEVKQASRIGGVAYE